MREVATARPAARGAKGREVGQSCDWGKAAGRSQDVDPARQIDCVVAESFVETRDESEVDGDLGILRIRRALADEASTEFVEFIVSLVESKCGLT